MDLETTVNLDETNHEKAIDFFRVYEYESHITTHNLTSLTYFGNKENRLCRFCGKSKPEVKFKNYAHLISQLLGNRYLLSAFECDTCNKIFGDLYENSLANYLGAYRPFSMVKPSKNNKYPKHKEVISVDNEQKLKLSIQQNDIRNINIVFEDTLGESLIIEKEEKRVILNATKNPYTEIFVYKIFLKMAISMINENEISYFKNAIAFLLDNTQNAKFKDFGLCRIYIHSLYGPAMFLTPSIYLYRKKKELESEPCPSKTFILYSANHIYQFFLPFNMQDQNLVGQKVTLYPYPVLLDRSYYDKGISYDSHSELLSGHEKVYNQAQKLVFTFDSAKFHDET